MIRSDPPVAVCGSTEWDNGLRHGLTVPPDSFVVIRSYQGTDETDDRTRAWPFGSIARPTSGLAPERIRMSPPRAI